MITIEVSGGSPVKQTIVYDGLIPNTDVTYTLAGETLSVDCGIADLDIPFGQFDFSAVIGFLIAFSAGCP